MFLALGVTLAYAQDAAPGANHQCATVSPRATTDCAVSDKHRAQR
jgi:hypothetical protein